jgi:orotidine-5'-phosphate decarboxylase
VNNLEPHEHLIVALDVPSAEPALDLVNTLRGKVGYFKIGLQLFTAAGPSIVERIVERDCKVFLDLKLHDIPNTVSRAVEAAVELGVGMLTLHTSGGDAMLKKAQETAVSTAESRGIEAPRLLGVTILTSMDEKQIAQVGFATGINELVPRLAHLADACSLDGIVCSPKELVRLAEEGFHKLFFVTPGIRPRGANMDDQARTNTPGQAISDGARYLVVGRPITQASDPVLATERIAQEIEDVKIGRQ